MFPLLPFLLQATVPRAVLIWRSRQGSQAARRPAEQKVPAGRVGVKAGLLAVDLFCGCPSQTSANILWCCKVLREAKSKLWFSWCEDFANKKEWSVLQQTIISARAHRLEYWKKYLCKTFPSYILDFPSKTNFKLIGPAGPNLCTADPWELRTSRHLQTHEHVLTVDGMKNVLIHMDYFSNMHRCCDE